MPTLSDLVTGGTPSQQEMMQDLRAADAAGDHQLAQHIAGVIRQHYGGGPNGAIAGEPDLGGVGNAALAGGIGFVHNLPFVGDAVITGGRALNDVSNGRGFNWQQANDEAHQTINSAQQQHPVASAVGGIGGAVDSAVIGGGALKAAGAFVPGARAAAAALALKRGQTAANVGRLAVTGAVAGGAQASGEQAAGGHFDQVAPAALGGAAVGAVTAPLTVGLGRAGVGIARRAFSLPAKSALALSKVFGENASDLQSAWDQHIAETGRAPSMAEMTAYKQTGILRGFAKNSTTIADALNQRAAQASLDRSANMQAGFQASGAASPETLGNIRTQQGDLDYPAARTFNFNIPTEESEALGGVSPADHLAGEILPQAGLGKADRVRIMGDLQNGQLSGQDAQLLRSGLSESLSRNYSPAVKGYLADFDSILGSDHAPGAVVDPNAPLAGNAGAKDALDRANANYAVNSNRVAGAEHGSSILGSDTADAYAATAAAKPNANPNFAAGMHLGANDTLASAAATPQGATSLAQRFANDDNLYQKAATTFGPDTAAALRRMGQAETASADAMAPFRGAPSPEGNDSTVKDAAHVAAAIATHGAFFKLYHGMKVFAGLDMPQSVQAKVADYLSDPKMAAAGIRLLAKAGASAARLRQITMTAAGGSGVLGGDVAGAAFNNDTPESPQ